jgi:hypothetical protein
VTTSTVVSSLFISPCPKFKLSGDAKRVAPKVWDKIGIFSGSGGDEVWNLEFFSYLSLTSSQEIELNEMMNVLIESR